MKMRSGRKRKETKIGKGVRLGWESRDEREIEREI